jgi:hypothetical protein
MKTITGSANLESRGKEKVPYVRKTHCAVAIINGNGVRVLASLLCPKGLVREETVRHECA